MISASTVITSTTPLWYATRATGFVALVLLTATVVLGILTSVRFVTQRWPRFVTIGIHRNLSLLVTVFLTLHIAAAALDPFAPVGWLGVVVPFVSAYRPLWLGLGTVAFDLLVALVITSLLRTRIGHRTWRAIHWAAYACWPLAVVHGLGTGTDPKSAPVILGIIVVCALCVLGAGAWRLVSGWPASSGIRLAAGAVSAVGVIAVGAWTVSGPLATGWAARAGTPAPLVSGASAGAAATGGTSTLPALPLSTPVTGTINTANSNSGLGTITINGTGESAVAFRVVITGQTVASGGVQMTSSQVFFGPSGQPNEYSGHITSLNGTNIQAAVTSTAGSAVSLALNLTINGATVAGTLAASSGSGQ
jgi:sulfoxide reductase heme-binding subunit YedZ